MKDLNKEVSNIISQLKEALQHEWSLNSQPSRSSNKMTEVVVSERSAWQDQAK